MSGPENGNGLYKGMPWWVKAAAIVGAPFVFSVVLLYVHVNVLEATRQSADAAVTEARGVLTKIREHQDDTVHMIEVLEKICRRVSKNDFEREGCD